MASIQTIEQVYYLLRNGHLTRLRRNKKGPSAVTHATVVIEAFASKAGYLDSESATATFTIINPRTRY